MAIGTLLTNGTFQGIGNDGLAVPYGSLAIIITSTGLNATTYQDSALTIVNANPITLSSSGKANVFLADGTYNITLSDALGVVIWTMNSYTVSSVASSTSSSGGTSAPLNPVLNQTYTDTGGNKWIWNGSFWEPISGTFISTTMPTNGRNGLYWYNPSNQTLYTWNGTTWIPNTSTTANAVLPTDTYITAVGGETSLNVTLSSGSKVYVLLNRVFLEPTVDYTIGSSSINLVQALQANDKVHIIVFGASVVTTTSSGTPNAIFGYGGTGAAVSMTNLVSNTGVVSADVTGVGTARYNLAASTYGTDKAIFGYGYSNLSMTNLVSNIGVVSTDVTGVGSGRNELAAATYGIDKAIFGYGVSGSPVSVTNLVSNTGVVSTDVTGVGTARYGLSAAKYSTDKAIFGYGQAGSRLSITNLVSNTGVVSIDTTGVGTARSELAASTYGTDKAIFGYGNNGANVSMTNLVSNTGVVATDTTGVGTARYTLAAANYGTDKAIFGYGGNGTTLSMTNLVSNTGIVATDTTGVGTARTSLAAAGY